MHTGMTMHPDLHFDGQLTGEAAATDRTVITEAISSVDAQGETSGVDGAGRGGGTVPLRHDWIVDARSVSDERTVYIAHATETDFAVSGPSAGVLADRIQNHYGSGLGLEAA